MTYDQEKSLIQQLNVFSRNLKKDMNIAVKVANECIESMKKDRNENIRNIRNKQTQSNRLDEILD